MSLPASFATKTMTSTCTVWAGASNSKGYGILAVDGTVQLAHRLAYEDAYGPIPEGHVIDHLCRVRCCVTPEHLEAVTQAENNRRGRSAAALSVGDQCLNGHGIAESSDLYARANGVTECMECRRVGRRANRAGVGRPTVRLSARSVQRDVTDADQARAS